MCVCVWERERECVCVYERERERECVCVCEAETQTGWHQTSPCERLPGYGPNRGAPGGLAPSPHTHIISSPAPPSSLLLLVCHISALWFLKRLWCSVSGLIPLVSASSVSVCCAYARAVCVILSHAALCTYTLSILLLVKLSLPAVHMCYSHWLMIATHVIATPWYLSFKTHTTCPPCYCEIMLGLNVTGLKNIVYI